MKQKIITYEIEKKDGEFVLWEIVEEHDFEKGRGHATNRVVFRGTKKECLERKKELNGNRTSKRTRTKNQYMT